VTSRSEFRHCQGFQPTKRRDRAASSLSGHTSCCKALIIGTSHYRGAIRQSFNHTLHKLNNMSLPNSQESLQMDLYDQDSYSIPEDELRSIGTEDSSYDDDDNTSMNADGEMQNQSIDYDMDIKKSTKRIISELSPPMTGKTHSSRTPSAETKSNIPDETKDHFDPSLSDRDLPHFRGRSMNEVLQALAENEENTPNGKISFVNKKQANSHDETEVEQVELPSPKDLSLKQSFGNTAGEIVLTVVEPTTKEVYCPLKIPSPGMHTNYDVEACIRRIGPKQLNYTMRALIPVYPNHPCRLNPRTQLVVPLSTLITMGQQQVLIWTALTTG
jgi:hypothetical protein